MSYVYELEIPRPSRSLSPNARKHWKAKTKPKNQAKEWAGIAALAHDALRPIIKNGGLDGKWVIDHDWYGGPDANGAMPRDSDNASALLKATLDGLKEVGLFKDDSAKFVQIGYFTRLGTVKEHGGKACVVLKFRPFS